MQNDNKMLIDCMKTFVMNVGKVLEDWYYNNNYSYRLIVMVDNRIEKRNDKLDNTSTNAETVGQNNMECL